MSSKWAWAQREMAVLQGRCLEHYWEWVGKLWSGRSQEEPVPHSPLGDTQGISNPRCFPGGVLCHPGLLEGAFRVFLPGVFAAFRKVQWFFLWHLTKCSWQSCQMCHCNGRPPRRSFGSGNWLGNAGPGHGGPVAECSQRKSFDSGACLLWQTPCACLDTMRVQDTWLLFGFPGGKALLFIWLNFWVVERAREHFRLCRSLPRVRVLFGDLLLSGLDVGTTETGSSSSFVTGK